MRVPTWTRGWSEKRWVPPALLVLAVAVAYHRAPNNVFHFDDDPNFAMRRSVQIDFRSDFSVERIARWGALERRLLPNLTLALDWRRGRGDPAPFQWTNITIHLTTTLVLFVLLGLWLSPRAPPTARLRWCAAAGALLWSLHPIQVQAVTYIVQRMTSMAALFVLITLWSWTYGRIRARRPWPYFVIAAISATAAALSKENAWVLPILIILVEIGICRHDEPLRRPFDLILVAIPMAIGAFVLIDVLVEGPVWHHFAPSFSRRSFTLEQRLMTQPRVIAFHFSQILWPLPARFSLLHDFEVSQGLLSPPSTIFAIIGAIGWTAAGTTALLKRATRRIGLLLLWVPATLAIESSIVPLELIFEHRMYLPTVGLAGLASAALARSKFRSRRWLVVGVVLVASALLTSTLIRVPLWSSRLALFEHVATRAPKQARVWNALGGEYGDAGRGEEALAAFDEALALQPGNARSHYGRGLYFSGQEGQHARALEELNLALEAQPDFSMAMLARGNVHARMGECERAIDDFDAALKLRADEVLAYVNRAVCRLKLRQYERALHDVDTALHIDPRASRAQTYRGGALLALGRVAPALAALDIAVEQNPDDPIALFWRGDALRKMGREREGDESMRQACSRGFEVACDYP